MWFSNSNLVRVSGLLQSYQALEMILPFCCELLHYYQCVANNCCFSIVSPKQFECRRVLLQEYHAATSNDEYPAVCLEYILIRLPINLLADIKESPPYSQTVSTDLCCFSRPPCGKGYYMWRISGAECLLG